VPELGRFWADAGSICPKPAQFLHDYKGKTLIWQQFTNPFLGNPGVTGNNKQLKKPNIISFQKK